MTEQQISKLKALLEASNTAENSPELDDKIIHHAQRPTEPSRRNPFAKTHGLLLSNSATAFCALLLTAVILFGLAEMTSVNDLRNPLSDSIALTEAPVNKISNSSEPGPPRSDYLLPSKRPANLPVSSNFSEDLLSNIELPSTHQLLDNMHLPTNSDRRYAEQAISRALADINHLLQKGNLENARLRYQQLRNGCEPCKLPQTLEALAQITSARMDSG